MKRCALVLGLLGMVIVALPARAGIPVVGDISTYNIYLDTGFTGTRLFIFGARNESGDVVVVVRGPQKQFTVRKREPVAGVWITKRQMVFADVPEFYALASSRPLAQIEADSVLRQMKIGTESLLALPDDIRAKARFPQFADAFAQHQYARGLWRAQGNVQFVGETLFKTVIEFPDIIPKGDYTAEIYLISDGELMGMQTLPVEVRKSGLDAFVYDAAHRQPALYGLAAIALALSMGWIVARLFRRL